VSNYAVCFTKEIVNTQDTNYRVERRMLKALFHLQGSRSSQVGPGAGAGAGAGADAGASVAPAL